ncbi:MAG: substrate-binding domain-containing protein [Deltaproteobacteria bacterium]|nr:substrate-binding domain-containing protein [Deltaproteobacteria bacterium]MBN2670087.1 substrate-binding domain-containing protein [Deltaproteobacteria bacterium]
MSDRRYTVGVLTDAVHELYQAGIWQGLTERAAEQGMKLITLVGTTQDGSAHFDTGFEERLDFHYQLLADIVVKSNIDAMILITSPITNMQGKEYVKRLCARFDGRPIVCIAEPVPGYHSVLVDNGSGIESTIEHLVSVHNLRNIAFVKGSIDHVEAEERYHAYKRGLEANNRTFRPELVQEGGFTARHGADAIKRLLTSNVEFDGVVAVNDYSAFGAMEELARNGILVPSEVAITGFDDVAEASMVTPSLATVRQPLRDLGRAAIDSVRAQLDNEPVDFSIVLPTMPVHRRSCGCFSKKVESSRAIQQQINGLSSDEVVEHLKRTALTCVKRKAKGYPGDAELRGMLENLVGSLVWDVQRPVIRNIFLNEVDMLLYRSFEFSDAEQFMHAILRELTMYVASLFGNADQLGEANNLLQQAGTFVREQLAGRGSEEELLRDEFRRRVNITKQRMISSFRMKNLLHTLLVGLPALGIRSHSVALFENPISPQEWNCPRSYSVLFAYDTDDDGTMHIVETGEMECGRFFPDSIYSNNRATNRVVMPLHFENMYIGFAVFEHSTQGYLFMYEELRSHLSSAISACLLNQKSGSANR